MCLTSDRVRFFAYSIIHVKLSIEQIRASSVLQRNMKLYGPMNALDTDNSSSCWNSEGSVDSCSDNSSWFLVDFKRPVQPSEIRIQFQAGFCAASCSIYYNLNSTDEWKILDDTIEWEDIYQMQSYSLPTTDCAITALKLVFSDTTDFYGRITVYRLEVWGKDSAQL